MGRVSVNSASALGNPVRAIRLEKLGRTAHSLRAVAVYSTVFSRSLTFFRCTPFFAPAFPLYFEYKAIIFRAHVRAVEVISTRRMEIFSAESMCLRGLEIASLLLRHVLRDVL